MSKKETVTPKVVDLFKLAIVFWLHKKHILFKIFILIE
jgi:hypothetical protein